MIRSYRGRWPVIAESAYIDPDATVIGDVTIGEQSSVWPGAVIRGDVHYIRIGARTNIQDVSALHVMKDLYPLILGDDVTVGHGVILHGCTIESHVLIGMGCILLNNCKIGEGSIIAAGTLVTEGTVVPPGSLFMGSPGKFRRALTAEDRASIDAYASRYITYAETYRNEPLAKWVRAWRFRISLRHDDKIVKFQTITGFRDILPPESAAWSRVEQTAREVFGTYAYSEIRTPILEPTELFARSIGAETDVVSKEMYTFGMGHDPDSLADSAPGLTFSMRPEATASVVRSYIEHGMHLKPGNVKLCYVGPMFRRERPQKGRYRQFYQIGAELLGPSDHPALDAEVIEMLMTLFERLKLGGTTLYLNSIGDKNCRPAYVERLREELRKVKDRLGPDSQRRIETNPLRVLDSKLAEEQPIIANLPHIAEHLCDDCRNHYAKLKEELALRGIVYEENWRLVRGLDYYMRTTFEITATGLGSQNAVCGGGRYDGLVELLGGPATTKGIGFAIGTDRLMLSLEQAGQTQARSNIDAYVAWFGPPTYATAVALARKLRERGFAVEIPAAEMKFGKSLSLADRLGARYAVILGEEELAAKQFTVKRLADGEQKKLSEAELLAYLQEAAR